MRDIIFVFIMAVLSVYLLITVAKHIVLLEDINNPAYWSVNVR